MKKLRLALMVLPLGLFGCEAVGPALKSLALAFGQDLIAAASVNHAPRYAVEVESLLVALAAQATGMQFQRQLAASGYQPRPRDLGRQNNAGYRDVYASNNPYGQPNDPYAQQPNDPYAQQSNDPYAQQSNDPYAQQSIDPYAHNNRRNPYAQPGAAYPVRSIAPIQLDAALLAQKAGTSRLVEVQDGDVLVDGGDTPARGDLLKVHFRTNCNCYVYVIGVDATGYVAQIYPDAEENHSNPVRGGASYLVPAGEQDWWAMDSFKGVEQVYFVASYTQRDDIEEALTNLAGMPRNVDPATYRPVAQAAIVPATRGLVKVKAQPIQVPSGNAEVEFTPTSFSSEQPGAEVVVTRWFRHE